MMINVAQMTSQYELLNKCGGRIVYQYQYVFDGIAVSNVNHDCMLNWLDDFSSLISIVEDDTEAHMEQTTTTTTWGLDRIDERNLPLNGQYSTGIWTGQGVDIYIIDTGTRLTHDEFTNRILNGYDVIDNDLYANDGNGHGTHVAGTAAGSIYGVAKEATIIPIRVLDNQGSGSTAGIIRGIDWMIDYYMNTRNQNPSVSNLSLGGGYSSAMNQAIQRAHNFGITMVVAAGNENQNAMNVSPASEPLAITVASSTINDIRSSFSNYGTRIDLFAPGSSITAAWHTGNTAYQTISGTSMAAPHVAGAVALLLQANPTLTPDEVATKLINMATPNVIQNANGSPNRLLFVGNITGGGDNNNDDGDNSNDDGDDPPTPPPEAARIRIEIIKDTYYTDTSYELEQRPLGSNGAWTLLQRFTSNVPNPFNTTVDLPNGEYQYTLYDSYGDALCCSYGEGKYVLYDIYSSTVIAQGGDEFTDIVVVRFDVINNNQIDYNSVVKEIPTPNLPPEPTCEGESCSNSNDCCPGTECEGWWIFKTCRI